ncbi:MAG: phosphoglycerate kinase [Thermoplasmata archaeon]|nr:phosphoglycerate kinase [Thermoplasmata archaeon]MCI4356843.1 phosphoglycerate kinase [Thermoplasmata archaeon]
MAEKRSVTEAAVRGRRVLVRVDFNVPQRPDGSVADDRRIVEALPTLKHLEAAGAKTVLLSHLGRPNGKRDMAYSLRPVAHRLSALLGRPVPIADDLVGIHAIEGVTRLSNGGFLMLENLRFHPGEEANDPTFAAELARLGDLFVEEAFGTVHRAHASTVGVPKRLPSCAGLLVQKEIRALTPLLGQTERPYVALMGGAKVSDKLPLLASFLGRVDTLLIGGALAFPFLAADGADLGATTVEGGLAPVVAEFREAARAAGTAIGLPTDLVFERTAGAVGEVAPASRIPAGARAFDIGPATRQRFLDVLQSSRTVFWNGPLGLAEDPRFSEGTREVLAGLADVPGFHVAAGGDSARVVETLGVRGSFQYLSTGGGAALEFVQGAELPGLAVLPDA